MGDFIEFSEILKMTSTHWRNELILREIFRISPRKSGRGIKRASALLTRTATLNSGNINETGNIIKR